MVFNYRKGNEAGNESPETLKSKPLYIPKTPVPCHAEMMRRVHAAAKTELETKRQEIAELCRLPRWGRYEQRRPLRPLPVHGPAVLVEELLAGLLQAEVRAEL